MAVHCQSCSQPCNKKYNGPKVFPQTFRFQEMENNDEDDTELINDNG